MEEDFPDIELPDFGGEEAVPVSAPQRAPAVAPTNAQAAPEGDPIGDVFAGLGEAITAGLQGLQEMFGLSPAQAAVPDPRGPNMQGAQAMFRGAGAYSGEEMKAIKKAVDPEDKLTEGVANLAGLMNAYETFTARGDAASAKKMAASIIQYSQQRSIALGGLALEAIRDGNMKDGAKALVQAFNVIPNGQQVSIENGVGVVKDMRSGKVVKEIKLTPQVMIAAAGKLASGEDYYKMLIDTAQGKVSGGEQAGLSADELNKRWEGKGFIDPRGASSDQLGWIKEENTRRYQTEIDANRDAKLAADEQKAAEKKAADEKKAAEKAADEERKADAARMKEDRTRNLKSFNEMWDDYATSKGYFKDKSIANDIRDTAEYILEENDIHPTAGIRAAQKIVDPRTKVELHPAEKGGGTVVIDGDEIAFGKNGFNAVKRLREGYSKPDKK